MRKVLMIAFHFPPAAMGSGHLRTLGFVRHLPDHGWEPLVLSANARAYPNVDATNNQLIPRDCEVHRAFALDAGRHLAIRGKYPGFLARPDRWISWWPSAVWQGLHLIRQHRVSAIWSTYPVMSAHRIANTLHHLTGLPWIADFRDPVASSVSSTHAFALASQKRGERQVLGRAAGVVFTTPGALQGYAGEYPAAFKQGRMSVIPNGFDEAVFADVPIVAALRPPALPLTLVHSGLLYRDGRNPVPFFTALANLRTAGALLDGDIRIVLRASGSESTYAEEIHRLGLDNMIVLAPAIPNKDALREQSEADALLLFQGDRFDRQIPAKVYEYLRTGRPILALVGPDGETAALLHETGGAVQVPMEDVPALERGLIDFIRALREQRAPVADAGVVRRYSRTQGAASLAKLLDKAAFSKGDMETGGDLMRAHRG